MGEGDGGGWRWWQGGMAVAVMAGCGLGAAGCASSGGGLESVEGEMDGCCAVAEGRVSGGVDGGERLSWRRPGGEEMPYTRWLPEGEVVAVVVAVHGLSGAASDFWPLGERLPQQGVAVYAMEVRGQGHEPRVEDRGDVRGVRLWRKDLEAFSALVAERHPGLEQVWYGESLGALIVLETVWAGGGGGHLGGLVLASPVVGFRDPPGLIQRCLLVVASHLVPRMRVRLEDLGDGEGGVIPVTSDTEHIEQMALTAHSVDRFTLRLLRRVGGLVERAGERAAGLDLPVAVLYTPNDFLTGRGQVEAFAGRFPGARVSLYRYDRSYHLILHDVQRWEAVADVGAWVLGRGGVGK
jgi:acylglycerol lipase